MTNGRALKVRDVGTSGVLTPLPQLTPQERLFADEYFAGEHAGNGTRSYLVVYPDASYATASVEASELLKEPGVREYLNSLHQQATGVSAGKLRTWAELLPMAQAVIVASAEGRLRNRLAYEAAVQIVNRVMGTPVATNEVHVRDDARIAKAVATFARRLTHERRRVR